MSGSSEDLLKKFCEAAIGPACVDFAGRIGAHEPSPFATGERIGYEMALPSALKDHQAKTVVVCAEPFGDDAFAIMASRPDLPGQLRRIALVRYDALTDDSRIREEATRIRGEIGNTLEQLHQGLVNR